jgi:hypothetical protein
MEEAKAKGLRSVFVCIIKRLPRDSGRQASAFPKGLASDYEGFNSRTEAHSDPVVGSAILIPAMPPRN